jgi:hypothetical protein
MFNCVEMRDNIKVDVSNRTLGYIVKNTYRQNLNLKNTSNHKVSKRKKSRKKFNRIFDVD